MVNQERWASDPDSDWHEEEEAAPDVVDAHDATTNIVSYTGGVGCACEDDYYGCDGACLGA